MGDCWGESDGADGGEGVSDQEIERGMAGYEEVNIVGDEISE